jgi:hypothetical protein
LGNLFLFMILNLIVSDDTIYKAKSLTDRRGSKRSEGGMDDILASVKVSEGRSIHIATLARDTIIESGAEHLGFQGYFLFEAVDVLGEHGINILGKAVSYEAALRLIDVLRLA